MPTLKNYRHFGGRHYETGTLHNALAYSGVLAPHSGQPISEALLLGISGGITVGYFTFEYEGYAPHIALLPRNTFNPLETIFERLAIPREILQTSKPEIGLKNLLDTLENGLPALVWLDKFGLSYNLLPHDARNWMVVPLLVYGVEGDTVFIADGSSKPLTASLDELAAARGRVKEDKHRIVVLEHPDLDRLPAAVQKGIWQCISLYTDAPPKGKRENFGLAALQNWADMLVNTRNKHGWERYLPPGSRLYAVLAGDSFQPGLIGWICNWGAAGGMERGVYAQFLDESAVILGRPALSSAAEQFRAAAGAWCQLANALLPDDVPLLRETRELKLRKHEVFVQEGDAGLDTIRGINARLSEIRALVAGDFPMSAAETAAWREQMRAHVLHILDIEREAVSALQGAMA
jgi:hypothetical protein